MEYNDSRKLPLCYRDLIKEEPEGYDSALGKAPRGAEEALWDYPMEPVPDRFWPQLVREGLVERVRQGERLGWRVSDRGQSQGLSWMYWFEGDKRREGPAWSGQARQTLEPMWTADPQGRRSLAGRLRELEMGCSVGGAVERFARTRLGAYLGRCPEELRKLEETLGVGPDAPFHQAAALIQDRLRSGERRVRKEGVRLMCLLARPFGP